MISIDEADRLTAERADREDAALARLIAEPAPDLVAARRKAAELGRRLGPRGLGIGGPEEALAQSLAADLGRLAGSAA